MNSLMHIANLTEKKIYDEMTMYLNTIAHNVKFKNWFFAHYHRYARVMGKFYCLYDDILQIA